MQPESHAQIEDAPVATEYTVPMLGWWRHDGPSLGEATRNSHELAMTDGTPIVISVEPVRQTCDRPPCPG